MHVNRLRFDSAQILLRLLFALLCPVAALASSPDLTKAQIRSLTLAPGQAQTFPLLGLRAGQTLRLLVTLESGRLGPEDRVRVELRGTRSDRIEKDLHAG